MLNLRITFSFCLLSLPQRAPPSSTTVSQPTIMESSPSSSSNPSASSTDSSRGIVPREANTNGIRRFKGSGTDKAKGGEGGSPQAKASNDEGDKSDGLGPAQSPKKRRLVEESKGEGDEGSDDDLVEDEGDLDETIADVDYVESEEEKLVEPTFKTAKRPRGDK